MPNERVQFRILFRDFLSRIVDLDAIAPGGDLSRLLIQFAALLAAFGFTFMLVKVPAYFRSDGPPQKLLTLAWYDQEFLIATTMVIAGLFAILAWNSVLPDRRDCLILTLLPVRLRTIFFAKVGAIAAALSTAVIALNVFTGLTFPLFMAPIGSGFLGTLRAIACYWSVNFLAALFVYCGLLAMQGLAMQLLPYRLFLKVSSFLQLAALFVILGAYFLKPPLANPHALTAPQNQPLLEWLPSFWFLGLFQEMNGPMSPVFAWLGQRALIGIAVTCSIAALTFGLAWRRNLRRIVEQPDIAPADRTRSSGMLGVWLVERLFVRPLDRAIVLFTARTLGRSRQHRLLLAAFSGIGLAIALAYARELLYGAEALEGQFWIAPWNLPNRPFLTGSMVMLFFAAVGTRAVFSLPYTLPANWIFRTTAVHPAGDYFRAVKRALLTVATAPVLIAAAILFFTIWPTVSAAQHLVLMVLIAVIVVERALYQFRKIPFACSYLPGKANLQTRLATIGIGFLFAANALVSFEYFALHRPTALVILTVLLIAGAIWAYRSATAFDRLSTNRIQFEELPLKDIHSLDLHSDGSDGGGELLVSEPISFDRPRLSFRAMLEQSARDFRAGTRIFAKSPGFSAAAVALIAIGIGGNAAIFSILHAILTRPAPGVHATNLVRFGAMIDGRMAEGGPEHSYLDLKAYSEHTKSVRSLIGDAFSFFTVTSPQGAALLRGEMVTPNFFPTLGVGFARGRGFTSDEEYGVSGLTAVIAYSVWQNQFEGDPDIIGRSIILNGTPATVIGVAERTFRGTLFVPNMEAAVPIIAWARLQPPDVVARTAPLRNMEVLGQLAPGVSLARAQIEFAGISKLLQQAYPDYNKGREVILVPYSASALSVWESRQSQIVQTLFTVVGLMTLLIVCANVANLMLGRAVARQREMAVRRSLGASRGQVLRMLVAEGLVLSLTAAVAAWFFASWTASTVVKFTPPLPSGARIEPDLSPDWHTAIYALALAVVSAAIFAVAPALRAWRQDLLPWLKAGEQSVAQGRSRLSQTLVAVQIALCVTLLTGAGLASRSVMTVNQLDLHFDKDHLLLVSLNTQGAAQSHTQDIALLERLRQRLSAIPGVTSASYASAAPGSGMGGWDQQAQVSGSSPAVDVQGSNAGPGYLATIGATLLAGRDIEVSDVTAGAPRAVINADLAAALWPAQNPLGRTFLLHGQPITVVGVAANGAYATIRPGAHSNFVFLAEPGSSRPGNQNLHLRYAGNLAGIVPAVRATIRQTDSRVSFSNLRTMQAELENINGAAIIIAEILGIFSTGALFVAAIGLYAVSAFQTARRTRDFGIRMALGASSRQVLGVVLREGLVVTTVGLAAGLALSLAVSKALGSVLIGVTATDPATYISVAALLALVSLVACAIPARRAARIDPMRALRHE